jgi:hypothetical protein
MCVTNFIALKVAYGIKQELYGLSTDLMQSSTLDSAFLFGKAEARHAHQERYGATNFFPCLV